MEAFGPFDRQSICAPVLCVRKLAMVWSEAQAQIRFLKSNRSEVAVADWLTDNHSGCA